MRSDSRRTILPLLRAILSGSYTPYELREFVGYCFDLALPRVHKLIQLGKLDLHRFGLQEHDVVYDCIADLFRRDEEGGLVHITNFFADPARTVEQASDEAVLSWLRMLVVGKVNNNIPRLYDEADPLLGSVLRNVNISVDREGHFVKTERFNETVLVPTGCALGEDLPPLPDDMVRAMLAQHVLVRDSIPTMMKKVHRMLTDVEGYQKGLPVVKIALMLKEIVQMRATADEFERGESAQGSSEESDFTVLVGRACRDVRDTLAPRYAARRGSSKDNMDAYMRATYAAILSKYQDGEDSGKSYFFFLKKEMQSLTVDTFRRVHRTRIEYFAREVRKRLKKALI